MTGILALLAGLLRLGFLANFISEPVLKGFIIGLALTIMIGQVPKLLGVEKDEGNFFEQLWDVIGDLGDTHGPHAGRRCRRRSRSCSGSAAFAPVVPGSLVAVLLGIVAVDALRPRRPGRRDRRPHRQRPAVVRDARRRRVRRLPGHRRPGGRRSCSSASPRASARPRPTPRAHHYEIDPNRELLGLGAANLGAGLSSGMVVNGSLSKTAVNGSAGARLAAVRPRRRGR